jgi:hypothetical protein
LLFKRTKSLMFIIEVVEQQRDNCTASDADTQACAHIMKNNTQSGSNAKSYNKPERKFFLFHKN